MRRSCTQRQQAISNSRVDDGSSGGIESCEVWRRDAGAMPNLAWRSGHAGHPEQDPSGIRVAESKEQAFLRGLEPSKEILRPLGAAQRLLPDPLDAPQGKAGPRGRPGSAMRRRRRRAKACVVCHGLQHTKRTESSKYDLALPRVIIGSPLFNHANDFREAIESILEQTFKDFALVLVDDCSTDETPAIAREYEALDSRVSYQCNAQRLGLIGNSHEAFNARARAISRGRVLRLGERSRPLASALAAAAGRRARCASGGGADLSAEPAHRAAGEVLKRRPWAFDTFGITESLGADAPRHQAHVGRQHGLRPVSRQRAASAPASTGTCSCPIVCC